MMPQMQICPGCNRQRYLMRSGYCQDCIRADERKAVAAKPERLREHPDLEEFEEYADRWYR